MGGWAHWEAPCSACHDGSGSGPSARAAGRRTSGRWRRKAGCRCGGPCAVLSERQAPGRLPRHHWLRPTLSVTGCLQKRGVRVSEGGWAEGRGAQGERLPVSFSCRTRSLGLDAFCAQHALVSPHLRTQACHQMPVCVEQLFPRPFGCAPSRCKTGAHFFIFWSPTSGGRQYA